MPEIESLVFFDMETTGLPFKEKNQTKIIELSFVAALKQDIEMTPYGQMPPVSKLTFVLNPKKRITKKASEMTGLSNKLLNKAPTFGEKFESIVSFLEGLPSPVCLIAHNGYLFDFPILLAECNDASRNLPANLFCLDSLAGFRSILKNTVIDYYYLENQPTSTVTDALITDDEDEEWPDLDISAEDWAAIDASCIIKQTEQNPEPKKKRRVSKKRSDAIKKVFTKHPLDSSEKENFKLTTLYKRLLNKEDINAHRAEGDCLMLLQCVVALKKDFLPWAENNCKPLSEIRPLIRY